MSQEPPAPQAGDGGHVTPIGARRTSIADLQQEVERLTAALHDAEQRRHAAEQTLADVGRMAAADAADLRARLAALEQERDAAGGTPPRRGLGARVRRAALRSDLGHLQATFAAAGRAAPDHRENAQRRIVRQAGTLLDSRPAGAALGSIRIPRIGLKSVFVESTGHDALMKGPGHYKGTTLPGLPGTVGLAGHRTTYGAPFRHVDDLPKGTRIEVRMPYGRFVYRVTGTQITTPDDAAALRSRATGAHLLVLTACHPLYSAAKRIVVTAQETSAQPV